MLRFLFAQRLRQAKRYFSNASFGRLLTVLLLCVVGFGVAFAVYGLLEAGLSEVVANEFLRVALPFFVYEMFLLVVSVLVFYSSLITGVFTLFRAEHDYWVVASPSSNQLIYDKLISVGLLSSWPLLVIALPALIAVNSVFAIGIGGFLLNFVAIALLTFLSVVLAFCILLALSSVARALYQASNIMGRFSWFATLVSLTLLVTASGIWWYFSGVDVATLFSVTNLQLAEANIAKITNLFTQFPSHLAALVLQATQVTSFTSAIAPLAWLFGLAVTSTLAVLYLSDGYTENWQIFQSNRAHSEAGQDEGEKSIGSVAFSDAAVPSLIKKEALAFFRNTRNQIWALFLVLLWLITVAFDSFMRAEISDESFLNIPALEFVQTFQLLVVVYFVAALSVRFVFPSFSLEKEQAWSLLSSPVSLVELFWAKASFFAGILAVLSALIAGVHVVLLGLSAIQAVMFTTLAVVAAVTVTLIGLALGAVFPNFQTTNPDVLATTLPGLSYVLLSLVYGSAASLTLYYAFLSGKVITSILPFTVVSLLLIGSFSYIAVRKLPTIEFEEEF